MRTITAYKLKDGTIIEDHSKAIQYCENKFGEELDGLLKECRNLGIQAKMDIMRAIIAKPKEFESLAKWVFEYYATKQED